MRKEPERERRELVCPSDLCNGSEAELLTFIWLEPYTEASIRMELKDDEQRAIETGIMMNPTLPPVIDGTGGIRQFDFSTPGNHKGSLHLTAFYCYLPELGKVALIHLTDEVGVLTPEERKELKEIFEQIQRFGPEAWEP